MDDPTNERWWTKEYKHTFGDRFVFYYEEKLLRRRVWRPYKENVCEVREFDRHRRHKMIHLSVEDLKQQSWLTETDAKFITNEK